MKLTNRANLPEAFVNAVKNDGYTKGDADASITELCDSPKAVILKKRHDADIVEDVQDRVWSLFGQVTHTILERANQTAIAERRLSIEVEGWKVSGGMDLYDVDGTLTDYKTTSVWSLIYDGAEKWERQLNCYAVLLRAHGHKVDRLQAVALLRDWSRGKAKADPSYPQVQVVNVPLNLWPADVAEKFLRERVILHKQARLTGELPDCTKKERWVREEEWAVKKVGGKKAVSGGVFDTEDEARTFKGLDNNLIIEYRPGKSTRCLEYCPALPWCKQGQSHVAQSPRPSDETTETKQAG